MKCSCIANDNFRFILEYKDDHLLFIDQSEWITSEYNTPIDTHVITIVNQDLEKEITINVGGKTIINYCDLPSKNECGSDGIYTFKILSCGNDLSRCEAVLVKMMCNYTKLLVQLKEEEYKDKVWPIYKQLEFVKANSSICNIEAAIEHYHLLAKMFQHLNCKC